MMMAFAKLIRMAATCLLQNSIPWERVEWHERLVGLRTCLHLFHG
jgi:hypothetical protein